MHGAIYAQHHHPHQQYGTAESQHHHMGPPPPNHYYAQPQYTATPMMPSHVSSYPAHHHPPPHYAYAPYTAAPQHQTHHHYAPYPHPPPNGMMALPAISAAQSSTPPQPPTTQDYSQREPDSTGQISPPGRAKVKVTATLWEEEGTLCFQVETGGICVARRQDNSMINGTKLLNVAKMTRGRRDGILKSEKSRQVIKIGPMHLKGVWITFERALEIANKEKITEQLYPLFVHNINSHIAVSNRPNMPNGLVPRSLRDVRAPNTNKKDGQTQSLPSQAVALTVTSTTPTAPTQSHTALSRPGIDRAHTYSAPSTNTSNGLGINHAGSSYEYGADQTGPQHYVDSKSLPTTPATTPPGSVIAPLHHQQYAATSGYEASRNASFSMPSVHQSPYATVPSGFGFTKSEMGPPLRSSKEGRGEAQSGYEHDRDGFAYQQPHAQVGPDNVQVSPHTKSSPQNANGQSTPLSSGTTPQGQWHPAYTTPQRANTLPSTGLIYASGNSHDSSGASNAYPTPGSSQNYQYPNGTVSSHKRSRDANEDNGAGDHENFKRRRTGRDDNKPRLLRR